jgi:oligopeptide transport system substrate-binding protein
MFRVCCDPSYAEIHESGCWNPAAEQLTLTIDGEEVTMSWQAWSQSMSGTGAYANAANETKLAILGALEQHYLELYYCIPIATSTSCSMLSYKLGYYTENYSIMYGFGGMRLLQYNYSDAEWTEYVASQGGELTY